MYIIKSRVGEITVHQMVLTICALSTGVVLTLAILLKTIPLLVAAGFFGILTAVIGMVRLEKVQCQMPAGYWKMMAKLWIPSWIGIALSAYWFGPRNPVLVGISFLLVVVVAGFISLLLNLRLIWSHS
jgi:hydrogenase-4 membrane subunit HyfE